MKIEELINRRKLEIESRKRELRQGWITVGKMTILGIICVGLGQGLCNIYHKGDPRHVLGWLIIVPSLVLLPGSIIYLLIMAYKTLNFKE